LKGTTFPPKLESSPGRFEMFVKEKDVDFKFLRRYSHRSKDIANTDLIVVLHGFPPTSLEVAGRFKKPVATIGNDWVVDVLRLATAGIELHRPTGKISTAGSVALGPQGGFPDQASHRDRPVRQAPLD
jgi:hypothetical protein